VRPTLRFLLPLLGILGVLAWAAAAFLNSTTRSWMEKDVRLRAQLVASGAREALAAHVRDGDRERLTALLDEMAQGDRIMALEVCGPDLRPLAATAGYPAAFGCAFAGPQVRRARPAGGFAFHEVERPADLPSGPVYLSALPILDREQPVAILLLVHDMSYVDRRETATNRLALLAFGLVVLAASAATVLAARFSWRAWSTEARRLLALMRLGGSGLPRAERKEFQPFLSDLRQLVSDLSAERGRWSPERLRDTLTHHLRGEGIVVVANREPYLHERAKDGTIEVVHPASGLVTALEPVMRACSGVWVAHGSGAADREMVDRHDRVRVPPGEESYQLRRVWLTREEEQGYYYGFANEGLWPFCHVVHARPMFREPDWAEYQRVNQRFAAAVCQEVKGVDPIVLVEDYHFALLPRLIREKLPRATVITFWHIPWPNAERFGICPWYREILDGLLGSSILGFHTQQHCNNFLESVDRYLETRIDRERQSVVSSGRETLVRPYPIAIEWPSRWVAACPPVAACRRAVIEELGLAEDALIGVGVDRLDYTKGIEERLLAIERLLERFPQYRGRFTFVQLAAPSRTAIPRYRQLNEDVEALATRINERFGQGAYRPVILKRSHHEPPAIHCHYRAADLCYVSSLHDGMNLVAKEFVSARDDERGVLVLSRFTGAARELTEALLVNPYDLEESSAALACALAMPPADQAERMRAMRAFLSEFNVYRWAGRMLVDAARLRQKERLAGRLSLGVAPAKDAIL